MITQFSLIRYTTHTQCLTNTYSFTATSYVKLKLMGKQKNNAGH